MEQYKELNVFRCHTTRETGLLFLAPTPLQQAAWINSHLLKAFLCGVCMLFLCLQWFSSGTLASSHSSSHKSLRHYQACLYGWVICYNL